MKKIYNYILLSVLAIASAGCINEELAPDQPSAEAGDEVKFGLSLGDPKTRTIYGEETTITEEQKDGTFITKTVFPIYWIDGDKVQVFSPQCLEGRRSAEYKVVLPSDVTNPCYADDLTPTGANGVQWGGNATADFYSLYPSGNYTLSSDGTKAENITINYTQSINVNGTSVKSDMEDCLMYAKTTGVKSGETVNLHYDPISTVVMLTLKVAANETGTDADSFTIQTIALTAPEGTDIAGTFSLNISNGTFVGFTEGKASNTITTQIVNSATGGYHTLSNGQSVTVPLFLAPAAYESVNGWKVQVVANGNTYTKTLNINKALEPGQIHKITLPELKPATTDWDVSKWMTYIPRNVYLSEVSIPGSWNSLNEDSQGTGTNYTSISTQYEKGVRAFHFDTRWKRTTSNGSYVYELGIADGGNTDNMSGISSEKVMTDADNPTFKAALDEIVENISTEEYMVVVCSFAQDSYPATDADNNDWVGAISKVCASNASVYDARNLTKDTVVGDVLGKVIVIINMEDDITSVPSNSKCLFVNLPLTLSSNNFGESLNDYNKGVIYNADASNNSTEVCETGINMYHTQAQICFNEDTYPYSSPSRSDFDNRGFLPTRGERKTVANNILDWSKDNFVKEGYAHDAWIYLGLGGYYVKRQWALVVYYLQKDDYSHDDVAAYFNTWINDKITEMGTTPDGQTTPVPYYPVGIVLMNYVNDYASTVKNILTLNNKYRQQFDSTKPSDYNPNKKSVTQYDASLVAGGDAF